MKPNPFIVIDGKEYTKETIYEAIDDADPCVTLFGEEVNKLVDDAVLYLPYQSPEAYQAGMKVFRQLEKQYKFKQQFQELIDE